MRGDGERTDLDVGHLWGDDLCSPHTYGLLVFLDFVLKS